MTPTVLQAFRFISPRCDARGVAATTLLAVLVGLDGPELAAQAGMTTGVIRGTVRDPAGDPVPGTVIVIRNHETDLLTTVETASSGTFVRTLLPPGTYDLTVAPADAGFGTERIEGAVLRVGGVLDLDVELRIVVAETVTVVSEAPRVIFNLTNADNYVDTAVGSLLFNFVGTLRSGLGDTRRGQVGLSVRF